MTQVRKRSQMTPKQASACCRPIDNLLDPELFKALSDPTRMRLFGCLVKCGRSCLVGEVAECCSVDLSVVSRHLQLLERAGILEVVKEGRTVSYCVKYGILCGMFRSIANAIEASCPVQQQAACRQGVCCAK